MADGSKKRRRWLRALVSVGVLAFVWWCVGCTSYVRVPTSPQNPTSVYLIKEEFHVGVVLPNADGTGYVEYGFGDWAWFGKGEAGVWNGVTAVLWPTRGAIGRREWRGVDGASLRRAAHFAVLDELVVDGRRVDELRTELRAQWESGRSAMSSGANATRRFDMVHHDTDYWLMCNCADVCADWIERLGCTVSWVPIRVWLMAAEG